jgi:type I restriction-modification system DNA methylase subunit
MILTDDIKAKIQEEFDSWKDSQYSDKDIKQRQALGQFFTPPELTIKMLEKFEDLKGSILDPTVGAGGLLAAAVIAGADPRKCYGIELDMDTALLCRERLAKLGVPRFNIKVGDALKDESYEFDESLEDKSVLYFKVEDLGMSKVKVYVETNVNGRTTAKDILIDFSYPDEKIKSSFTKIYKLFETANSKDFYFCSEKSTARMKFLNAFFKKYVGTSFKAKNSVDL